MKHEKTPTKEVVVTKTSQLSRTSEVDNNETDSQVDTNSVTRDFSIDKIEKETEPGDLVIDLESVDKLQRQMVTDPLDSSAEYTQERVSEFCSTEEESSRVRWTVDSQRVTCDLMGQ
jgi:hydrogenase maturation factor